MGRHSRAVAGSGMATNFVSRSVSLAATRGSAPQRAPSRTATLREVAGVSED
jgi:hypothetical protein